MVIALDTRLGSAPIPSCWAVVPLQVGSQSDAVCSSLQACPLVFQSHGSSPLCRLIRLSPSHMAALLSPSLLGFLLVTWQLSSLQARSVISWSRGSSLSPNSFCCILFPVTSYTRLLFRAPCCCAIWEGSFRIYKMMYTRYMIRWVYQ